MALNSDADKYNFQATLWIYPGKAAWYFITVPPEITTDIDRIFSELKRSWGSLRVEVEVGTSKWTTSIFPDKKSGTYLLPVKKEIRVTENLSVDDTIEVKLKIIY